MSFNDNNRYQRFITDLLDMLQDFDTELKQINPLTDGEKKLDGSRSSQKISKIY